MEGKEEGEKNRSKENKKIREREERKRRKQLGTPLFTLELFNLTYSNTFLLFAILIPPIKETRIISAYI